MTAIEDDEREREWQDLLDVILVFVRLSQQYPNRLTDLFV